MHGSRTFARASVVLSSDSKVAGADASDDEGQANSCQVNKGFPSASQLHPYSNGVVKQGILRTLTLTVLEIFRSLACPGRYET